MAVVDVLDNTGNKVSQVSLDDAIFSVPINKGVIHQVVTAQLSRKRAGTASVKGRSDVVGSGRKLYKQKGTGRARKGNIKSPILRGGGVVFGPTMRSYTKKVPKKIRRAAIRMAVSSKLKENQLIIINGFGLIDVKTKVFVNVIENIKATNSLIITANNNDDTFLSLSARNVPKVKVLSYKGLNALDILKFSKLVIIESSLESVERKLS